MKFLCVPCDQPMKLRTTSPPDRGSLSVVYTCPACDYEMAMLTNPFETQLIQSLGVRIGPQAEAGAAASEGGSGAGAEGDAAEGAVRWSDEARARLENIPAFVRPMARSGIERFALDRGRTEIDAAMLDEARAFFGM
jgi:hypothetical protein